MKRKILFTVLTAMAAIACDPGGGLSTRIAGSAAALVETATDPEVPGMAAEEPEDESTPAALVVTWTDSADTSAVADLSFSVTNASDVNQSFDVAVAVRSLVGEARTGLGEMTLDPGEIAAFSIAAQDLPVRSSVAVGQVFVELTREIAQSDGAIVSSELLAGRFIRHEPGYGSVRTFNDETFQSELGGTLWSTATAAEDLATTKAIAAFEAAPLGDVFDGAGGYDVVAQGAATSDLLVRNDDGVVVGFLASVREIALTPTAAAEAAEMEASHE